MLMGDIDMPGGYVVTTPFSPHNDRRGYDLPAPALSVTGLDLHPAVGHFFRFWLWLTTGMVTKEDSDPPEAPCPRRNRGRSA
jgi:hypothetical protein